MIFCFLIFCFLMTFVMGNGGDCSGRGDKTILFSFLRSSSAPDTVIPGDIPDKAGGAFTYVSARGDVPADTLPLGTMCRNGIAVNEQGRIVPAPELGRAAWTLSFVMTFGTDYVGQVLRVARTNLELTISIFADVVWVETDAGVGAERRGGPTEYVMIPETWAHFHLVFQDTKVDVFINAQKVAQLPWNFAGIFGFTGDPTLDVEFGLEAQSDGVIRPQALLHSILCRCDETPSDVTLEDATQAVLKARQDCRRPNSPLPSMATGAPTPNPFNVVVTPAPTQKPANGTFFETKEEEGFPAWFIACIVVAIVVFFATIGLLFHIIVRKRRATRIRLAERALERNATHIKLQHTKSSSNIAEKHRQEGEERRAAVQHGYSRPEEGETQSYASPLDF